MVGYWPIDLRVTVMDNRLDSATPSYTHYLSRVIDSSSPPLFLKVKQPCGHVWGCQIVKQYQSVGFSEPLTNARIHEGTGFAMVAIYKEQ